MNDRLDSHFNVVPIETRNLLSAGERAHQHYQELALGRASGQWKKVPYNQMSF